MIYDIVIGFLGESMLNVLWAGMMLIGIVWGAAAGNLEEVGNALIQGGQDAVSLCITMLGVMGMWCGMMEIAKESGLVERLTALIRPFIHFMFPRIPKGHEAEASISLNVIANILGLGWAATPAGLKAMEALQTLNEEEYKRTGKRSIETASNEMCIFLILNISSLQLIPVNLIAYRSQFGSVAPAIIVGPAMLATLFSTITAVVFCKVMDR